MGTGLVPPLNGVQIALIGGASPAAAGVGQAGGNLHIISSGGIAFDPSASGAPLPSVPDPPAAAISVGAPDLKGDASVSGAAVLKGTVQSGGADPVRHIVAAGDLYISGTLRGADLGSTRQGFDIAAPGHTVYISGTVDTTGAGGLQAGGAVTINADRIVISGNVRTMGNAGGAAGALSITATTSLSLGGTLDASGGDGTMGGGPGGQVKLVAGTDIAVAGTVRTRGGAASGAKGADAGSVVIDCAGSLTWSATLDGRGGGTGNGAAGAGGAAAMTVGGMTRPKVVVITVPAIVSGGPGTAAGGDGGSVELDARGGDLLLAGTLDVSGGDSAGKPGAGGTILGYPGPDSSTANLDISGKVHANGGSVAPAGKNASAAGGGAGGLIKFVQQSLEGNTTTEATADIRADGGKSGGTGTAGAGGMIYIFTKHGNGTIHGHVQARGGDAPDAGGTGGGGGFVYVFTGDGHDWMSGVLLIAADGVIDASGGGGTIGGSARNDGKGGVAIWPTRQDDEFDVEQTAVLINSDGVHGADRGWIDNQGKIVARGGATNGAGGDVQYHGRRQDGDETPLPGKVDNAGDGTGRAGDFAAE